MLRLLWVERNFRALLTMFQAVIAQVAANAQQPRQQGAVLAKRMEGAICA